MDIAQYISLFLLKNKYCCLQGLGNVEIKKSATQYNGSEIIPGQYYAHFEAVGSIDDSFPYFVASNEHISIAKATNEISAFIKQAKEQLQQGKTVSIPTVGHYLMHEGKILFELDPLFATSQPSTTFQVPTKIAEESSPVLDNSAIDNYNRYNQQQEKNINWGMVAFWGIVVLIVAGVIAWTVQYFLKQSKEQNSNTIAEQIEPNMAPQLEDTSAQQVNTTNDTSQQNSTTDSNNTTHTAPQVQNTGDSTLYHYLVQTYNSAAKAERRQKQLNSFGYTVQVQAKDSNHFELIAQIKSIAADTSKMKDSLRKNLNPTGQIFMIKK